MGSDLNGGLPEYEERVKDFMFSLFAWNMVNDWEPRVENVFL
jgi:hypothetical protein